LFVSRTRLPGSPPAADVELRPHYEFAPSTRRFDQQVIR
jgi:hypothetical protein